MWSYGRQQIPYICHKEYIDLLRTYTEAYGNCKEDMEIDIWCIRNSVWVYKIIRKKRTESVSAIWKDPYSYKEYMESMTNTD